MNVLIVDDQASQRAIIRHLIRDIDPNITITDFADPVQALLWSQKEPPDMVILDYRMPKMDGLEFARRFRHPLSQRDVPVMLVTVVGDEPLRQAALDAGIIDFMVKPIRPRELRSRCKNLLELRRRQQALKSRTHVLEHQLLSGTHEMELSELNFLSRLAKLANECEGADPDDFGRIGAIAGILARGVGLDDREARRIERAAQLHDLGNIGLADSLFTRPGPLLDHERLLMQAHTARGHDLMHGKSELLQMGAQIALGHHEHWDGNGYPSGLKAEQIPLAARIVAVADVLDALLSARPYRDKWTVERALQHLSEKSATQFDPDLIRVMQLSEPDIIATLTAFDSLHSLATSP